ncbi:unnamed protein product [Albugo candida]|uniref:Uncharacterized protein n=1 Tax=Albugo candida TaxID=65357 RepID=A0A024GBN0_9STRA|nr:unnamed protein product [Albugo candida]|eukprot:CCI44178.1 unnamed protein product [Albugo candida]
MVSGTFGDSGVFGTSGVFVGGVGCHASGTFDVSVFGVIGTLAPGGDGVNGGESRYIFHLFGCRWNCCIWSGCNWRWTHRHFALRTYFDVHIVITAFFSYTFIVAVFQHTLRAKGKTLLRFWTALVFRATTDVSQCTKRPNVLHFDWLPPLVTIASD